jgi:putative ABC transport system substrate-binding protein
MRRSRRAFVGGLAAATAIGLPALVSCAAAGTKVPTKPRLRLIGWLGVRDPGYIFLHQTLPELGWVEGRDFRIEVRHADGLRERLPALAAELLTLPVDVLVTSTIEPTRVAMQATAVTPIVFTGFGGDPVKEGFIASLSRPGGNVTGVGTGDDGIQAKRLELLKEMLPRIAKIAVLHKTDAPDQVNTLGVVRDAARALAIEVEPVRLNFVDEVESACDRVVQASADGLVDLHAPTFFGPEINSGMTTIAFTKLLDFAVRHRLPQAFGLEPVRAGGLMGVGTNRDATSRLLAMQIDKILKGANPAELPVARNIEYQFALNLTMARNIGLTVPDSVMRRVTEVIR